MMKVFTPAFALLVSWALIEGCTGVKPANPTDPAGLFKPSTTKVEACDGLRVATLNTEFLFDGKDPDGGADFDWKNNPTAAAAHRQKVGKVVKALNADVILLAEVENEAVVQALVDESLAGMGYQVYFVQGNDTFTGQDLAIVSRVPIGETARSDEQLLIEGTNRKYGVSKNLLARFEWGGLQMSFIGVHFLANPSSNERKPQRETQAEVIRRMVARELELGRAVIVGGDFNDYDEASLDRSGSVPISNVLRIIKSAGKDASDDLRNLLGEVPQKERFTSHYDKNEDNIATWNEFTAIDHLLVSPVLYRRLRSVQYLHPYDPTEVTDHFPLTACFSAQ